MHPCCYVHKVCWAILQKKTDLKNTHALFLCLRSQQPGVSPYRPPTSHVLLGPIMSTHELCNQIIDFHENRNSHFFHNDADSEISNSSIFANSFDKGTFSKGFNNPEMPKLQRNALSHSSRFRQPQFF